MGKYTRHSAILIAAYLFTLLLNYGFGVTLSWYFTPAQFGVLGVAQSLLLLIALAIGSGFAWTANHDIAASGVQEDSRRRFRAAFTANTILGIILASILWAAVDLGFIPLGEEYQLVIPFLGLTVAFLAARSVISGAARGLFLFTPVAINLVLEVMVKIIAGVSLVILGAGVPGIMAAFALGAAISLVHSLWIVRGSHLWRGSGWFDRKIIRSTLPLFIGMLSTALMLNLDVLGLKLFAPDAQADAMVGYYQAAVILSRGPIFIAQAITLVLFSYASGLTNVAARGERTEITPDSGYLTSALKTWFRLLLPAGLVLAVAPKAALTLFFPPQYLVMAPALRITAIGAVILALVTLLNGVLQASGKRKISATATGAAVILQIILLAILVPASGIQGAAYSLLIASLAGLVLLVPVFYQKNIRESFRILPSIKGWVFHLSPLIVLLLPLVIIPDSPWRFAAVQFVLAGLFYGMSLYALQRQADSGANKQPIRMFSYFVRVLLGG